MKAFKTEGECELGYTFLFIKFKRKTLFFSFTGIYSFNKPSQKEEMWNWEKSVFSWLPEEMEKAYSNHMSAHPE